MPISTSLSDKGSWSLLLTKKRKRKKSTSKKRKGPPRPADDLFLMYWLLCGFTFFSGVALTTVSIWSFLRKLPYYVVLEVRVDVPYFLLPAGILCLPCFWIMFLMRRSAYYMLHFTHLLIFLEIVGTGLLIAGASIGMLYSSKVSSPTTNLTTSLDTNHLNASLQLAILEYNNTVAMKLAWDKMQSRLECCGVRACQDWMTLDQPIANSCCPDAPCSENNSYLRGCLDSLGTELVWQRNFVSSHCFIGIVINLIASVMVVFIYSSNKVTSSTIV